MAVHRQQNLNNELEGEIVKQEMIPRRDCVKCDLNRAMDSYPLTWISIHKLVMSSNAEYLQLPLFLFAGVSAQHCYLLAPHVSIGAVSPPALHRGTATEAGVEIFCVVFAKTIKPVLTFLSVFPVLFFNHPLKSRAKEASILQIDSYFFSLIASVL